MPRKLPTLMDVARTAGVSYATVDRVVNRRGPVAEKSASRVREAIETLGYQRNVAAANLATGRTYRFVALIPGNGPGNGPGSAPGSGHAFFDRLTTILDLAATSLRAENIALTVQRTETFDAPALSARLSALVQHRPDAVMLVGMDDPGLRAAIEALRAAGTEIVTLVSDISGVKRAAYVGMDNHLAGQVAGRLIGLSCGAAPGLVLPVIGDRSQTDHLDRLAGLKATLAAHFPALEVLPDVIGQDHHDAVRAAVEQALADRPAISAIYNAGAGNAGLIAALTARDQRPVAVTHELDPETTAALEAGQIDIVIDQRPGQIVGAALDFIRRRVDDLPAPPPDPIGPAIYLKENLPPL